MSTLNILTQDLETCKEFNNSFSFSYRYNNLLKFSFRRKNITEFVDISSKIDTAVYKNPSIENSLVQILVILMYSEQKRMAIRDNKEYKRFIPSRVKTELKCSN